MDFNFTYARRVSPVLLIDELCKIFMWHFPAEWTAFVFQSRHLESVLQNYIYIGKLWMIWSWRPFIDSFAGVIRKTRAIP